MYIFVKTFKNFYMKNTMLFLTMIVLMSCSKEDEMVSRESEINQQEVKAKEIQSIREFHSMEEFDDYYTSFRDQQSFDNAAINYRKIDPEDEDEDGVRLLSPMLRSIMNENNEFKIADTIIKLKNKKFYKFNINDRHLFEDNLELYVTDFIQNSALNNALGLGGQGTLASLKLNDIGGSHQHEFYKQAHMGCNDGLNHGPSPMKLKYVHELVSEYYVDVMGETRGALYLDVKLEWNNSGNKWKKAGEGRNMNINIQGLARIVSTSGGAPYFNYNFNINQGYNCSTDRRIFITQYNLMLNNPKLCKWEVTSNGVINHSINNTNIWNDAW